MARQIETNFVMRQIPTPAANASGYLSFYPKTDNNFYLRTSAGVEQRLATATDLGNYLPLTGGTVTGALTVNGTTTLNAVSKVGTTMIPNLNADLLDGKHADYFTGYVQARGMNLVTNGSGFMGNNYNFPTATFDQTDTHGGLGSFANTIKVSTPSTESIPVDPDKYYLHSVWGKAGDSGGINYSATNKAYIGISERDIDGNNIEGAHAVKHTTAVDTTLALPLNIGDTTMTLVDGTGWNAGYVGGVPYFLWFPYTNNKGYTYPLYGYSRNYTRYLRPEYNAGTIAAVSGNVITLSAPWPGPALAANTPVRQCGSGGGTYKYFWNGILPNSWTNYKTTLKPAPSDYSYGTDKFYNGTAYVKIMLFYNYGTTLCIQRFSDIWFSEISANNLDAFQVPITSILATGTAPLIIASTTLVTNLNADYLDNQHGAYYLNYDNLTNKPTSFPPAAHTHDDRYFTETESDARYALASHTHNYLSGSGTANYLSKFAAAGVLANSVIYEEDGLVGIGTNSPAHELHVNGTVGASQIRVQSGNDIMRLTGTYLELGDSFNYKALFKVNANSIEISGNDMANWTAFPISIGSVGGGFGNGRYIKIDDTADTFTINLAKVNLPLATANAFVKTDANKELVYDTGLYTKVSNFDNYRIPFGTATAGTFDCTSKFQYISSGGGMLKVQSESSSDFPTFYLHNREANLNGAVLQLESGTGSTYVAVNKLLGDFRFLSSGNYAAGMWAKATALHTDTTSPTRLGFYNVGETANSVLYERMTINPNGSVQINAGQQIVSPFMFRVSSNATTDAFEVTPDKVYSKNKIETADLFTAGGLDGMSGSSIILTGCTYNSGTRTLLFTRASLTVTGGIITQVTSESRLSVPLL